MEKLHFDPHKPNDFGNKTIHFVCLKQADYLFNINLFLVIENNCRLTT